MDFVRGKPRPDNRVGSLRPVFMPPPLLLSFNRQCILSGCEHCAKSRSPGLFPSFSPTPRPPSSHLCPSLLYGRNCQPRRHESRFFRVLSRWASSLCSSIRFPCGVLSSPFSTRTLALDHRDCFMLSTVVASRCPASGRNI